MDLLNQDNKRRLIFRVYGGLNREGWYSIKDSSCSCLLQLLYVDQSQRAVALKDLEKGGLNAYDAVFYLQGSLPSTFSFFYH